MRTQTITLEIVYDEQGQGSPMTWDWHGLLDLQEHETVATVRVTKDQAVPESDDENHQDR